jgi:hypothetical protein
LVEEFATRWNYALPAYPPAGYDYAPELKKKKLSKVPVDLFSKLKYVKAGDGSELSKHLKSGQTVVHEVEHFPGIFRSLDGKTYDLRPNDEKIIKPCLQTFVNMPMPKLQSLLLKSYKAQL